MLTEEKIIEMLAELEQDERLAYKTANVFSNAPLALIQYSIESKIDVLRQILEKSPLNIKKLRNE